VDVVAYLGGDRHQGQSSGDGLLKPLDVELVIGVVNGRDLRGEEPVGRPDRVGPALRRGPADAGVVRLPVGLRGQHLRLLLSVTIDEVLVVDAFPVFAALALVTMVTERREEQRQRRESLLTINNEVRLHADRPV